MESIGNEPKGIGGWLLLPLLSLCISPILILVSLTDEYIPIFTEGIWELLTTPGSEAYHPNWAPVLIYEMVGNLLLGLAAIVLLVFMLNKHHLFPKLYIAFLAGNLLFVISDHLLARSIPMVAEMADPDGFREIARAVGGAVIWIPYMLKSERVANTFARPRPRFVYEAYSEQAPQPVQPTIPTPTEGQFPPTT
ncbi:DUF2569 family protein [candidate division GN15 bacterium]|nr:DUF2569 family protein [candidate division GN15 bacterium]